MHLESAQKKITNRVAVSSSTGPPSSSHGGHTPQSTQGFGAAFGRHLAGGCNVAWALQPEVGGWGHGQEGGFVCVPGSHKACVQCPLPAATSLDLPCVRKPQLNKGDVLFFNAVAHGTTAWRNPDWDRRTVIQFMGSADRVIEPDPSSSTAGVSMTLPRSGCASSRGVFLLTTKMSSSVAVFLRREQPEPALSDGPGAHRECRAAALEAVTTIHTLGCKMGFGRFGSACCVPATLILTKIWTCKK